MATLDNTTWFDNLLNTASTVGSNVINAWGAAEVQKYSAPAAAPQPAPTYSQSAMSAVKSNSTMILIGGALLIGAIVLFKRG